MHRFALPGLLIASIATGAPAAEMVPVRLLATHYGFPVAEENSDGVRLESRWTTVDFHAESRRVFFNKTLFWMHEPLLKTDGGWSIASVDANRMIVPLLSAPRVLAKRRVLNIVLDPGHGGEDSGAAGKRHQEKAIVLDLAQRVRTRLRRHGFAVRLTRADDYALELEARTDRARRWYADLFVSLHLNAAPNQDAAGIETYCLTAPGQASTNGGQRQSPRCPGNAFDRESILLAYRVHAALVATTGSADRGIRRARFAVLRDAPCPAILVECGFISNAAEERRMGGWRFRRKAAEGITRGIMDFADLTRAGD